MHHFTRVTNVSKNEYTSQRVFHGEYRLVQVQSGHGSHSICNNHDIQLMQYSNLFKNVSYNFVQL